MARSNYGILDRTEARRFREADSEAESYRQGVQKRIAYLESLLGGPEREEGEAPNPPRLSFGRAIIPREPQKIELPEVGGQRYLVDGRVIRVPVTNAHGASEARNVHARLVFQPKEIHRGNYQPEHPIRGEWFSEHGPETEITLPGNGASRLFDVALVSEGGYPNVYEWTNHSRAARLSHAHVVKANPVEVQIEVMGAGLTPRVENVLTIEVGEGMLRADWRDRSVDESTNWAPRKDRGTGFRTE